MKSLKITFTSTQIGTTKLRLQCNYLICYHYVRNDLNNILAALSTTCVQLSITNYKFTLLNIVAIRERDIYLTILLRFDDNFK